MIDGAKPGDLLFVRQGHVHEDDQFENPFPVSLPMIWRDEDLEDWEFIDENTPLFVLRRFNDEIGVLYEVLTQKGKGVIGSFDVKKHSDFEG